MFGLVVGGLAIMGATVFSVLDQPVSRNRHRNRQVSGVLLAICAGVLLVALIYGVTRW